MGSGKKEAPTNIFEPTQLPDNSAKISIEEPSASQTMTDKPSDMPNW